MPLSTIQPANPTVEIDQMRAARRLIVEVYRVVEGKKQLDEVFTHWRELMVAYRQFEKRCLIDVEPSPSDLSGHRELMNRMIFCADSIVNTASRSLEINFHLASS